ncbi:MAG: protein jag [Ruminococcus sp.]|nr:protein jag [Ruminococcus sp.]
MIKEAIGSGETIEIALQNAYNELGIESSEASDFTVIQQPEKKKLGLFGGKEAKVKVTFEIQEKKKESPAKVASDYLRNILDALGLEDLKMTVKEDEESAEINLEGDDSGFVIGRRGDTLNALQYLTGLVANHVDNNYYKISINIGNYREKREKTLEILGRKLAFKAAKTGYKTSLEPMNPYERRIIHTAVQKVNGAISWSEGENINRHVVIGPDPESRRRNYKNNYNKNSRYNNNRGRRGGYSRSGESTAKSTPTREPINEGSLYGKL